MRPFEDLKDQNDPKFQFFLIIILLKWTSKLKTMTLCPFFRLVQCMYKPRSKKTFDVIDKSIHRGTGTAFWNFKAVTCAAE
jgi:hypothetical protein